MNEADARNLLLVRAVEQEDRDSALLTEEDRRQADAFARGAMAETSRDPDGLYLARRSQFAARSLEARHPAIDRAMRISRWPHWVPVAIPVLAFFMGMAANELGNARRLDLLAFPLLGTFLWNFAVYLSICIHPLISRRKPDGNVPSGAQSGGLVGWITSIGQRTHDGATLTARALNRFARDWASASAPLAAARTARILHLGAALFALGLVAGIYLRALAIEYHAGWESTFLGPGAVHALLSVLLGPASAVTGLPIPGVDGIAALRWTGPDSGGSNAAPWIHLYTATAIGFIVLPRLALAAWASLRAARIVHTFPVPGREDFYIRRLHRSARGGAGSVRITPYAFQPDVDVRQNLERLLRGVLGDGTRVHFDEMVDYGAEDAWLASATLRPDDDHHIVLFNLSATPEAENHGAFAGGLARALGSAKTGTAIGVILDESAFRRHFAGQAGLDNRMATRRKAWDAVLTPAGAMPLALDLANGAPGDIQRIEAAFVSPPMPEARA